MTNIGKAVIYLKPTKELKRRLLASHLVPGIVLIFTGLDALSAGEKRNIILILLNFLAGGLLFATVIIEMKRAGSSEHRAVGWVEVFTGLVLMVEGANHFHPGRGFQPAILYWAVGLATVFLGVLHAKIARIRRVTLEEGGFLIRTTPFRRLKMNWKGIAAIDFQDSKMLVMTEEGREKTISLRQVENIEEIKAGFKEWMDRKPKQEPTPSAVYEAKEN